MFSIKFRGQEKFLSEEHFLWSFEKFLRKHIPLKKNQKLIIIDKKECPKNVKGFLKRYIYTLDYWYDVNNHNAWN